MLFCTSTWLLAARGQYTLIQLHEKTQGQYGMATYKGAKIGPQTQLVDQLICRGVTGYIPALTLLIW